MKTFLCRYYLFLLLLALPILNGQANTFVLLPGNDIHALQKLIDQAAEYDTVLIKKGTHHVHPVTIAKPLTLLGEDSSVLHSIEGDELLLITAKNVSIIGLVLTGVETSYLKERSAIRVVKTHDFIIRDNVIEDCFFGIYLEHTGRGKIIKNRISGQATTEAGSGNAIHAWYCNHLEISENDVTGHRDGIYFEFVNDSRISKNHSHDNNRYGLHFMFSNDDKYYQNEFYDNGSGVAVMFSKNIEMINNRFSYNWGNASYGLLLKEINDASVSRNRFDHNTIGIFVEGSNRITYNKNEFRENGWGIKFSGGCSSNQIKRNNFISNSLDLVVSTKLSDNVIAENYWSEYTGYDLNRDNIGDIPHYPVKLFSYILDQVPEAIVLMRSFFVEIINFSEKVSPVFTPKEVFDPLPQMHPVK